MKKRNCRYRLVAVVASLCLLAACTTDSEVSTKPSDTLSAALWELAAGAEQASDHEKAASYYDRLYERDPNSTKALLGYARNLRYLGLPKDSVKSMQAGIEKHGMSVDLAIELGKSQLAAAMINDAKETFTNVIKLDPNRWESHSANGIIQDRLGQFPAAQASYARALELSPKNAGVINNLALSLSQSGQLDKAITMLEEVVAGEGSTPQARQNLAMLYGLKGDFEKAETLSRFDLPPDMVAGNLATYRVLHADKVSTMRKPKAGTSSPAIPAPKKVTVPKPVVPIEASVAKKASPPRPKLAPRPQELCPNLVFEHLS